MKSNNYAETDPRRHTSDIKHMLEDTARRAREDIAKVNDVKAQALFETSAEVLDGLRKAYDDFEGRSEAVWR